MPISISNENKNSLAVTNESKFGDETWDEADYTWDNAGSNTWDTQGVVITKESKNTLSISNESKT